MIQTKRIYIIVLLTGIVVFAMTACEDKKAPLDPATVANPTTNTATDNNPDDVTQVTEADASDADNTSADGTASNGDTPAMAEQPAAANEPMETETDPEASPEDPAMAASEANAGDTVAAAPSMDSQDDMLSLARKSGCLACHKIDKKMVGPSWKDVAARYQGNPKAKAQLIEKVSKGGRGNWTDMVGNVAMPPYSPRVSSENIEKLVDFVLSLN